MHCQMECLNLFLFNKVWNVMKLCMLCILTKNPFDQSASWRSWQSFTCSLRLMTNNILMLCKRWISKIRASLLFELFKCWKLKNITFLLFNLMNTNIWIPQNLNYIENLTIFKFWWIFLFVDGGWICCLEACGS